MNHYSNQKRKHSIGIEIIRKIDTIQGGHTSQDKILNQAILNCKQDVRYQRLGLDTK